MQYNKTERMIAFMLSRFPNLKQTIKKNYQKLNYLKHKKDFIYKSDYKITKISHQNEESFFGYYDKSPININNNFILFNSVNNSTKNIPTKDTSIDIVLYDIKNNIYSVIDTTYTYNWQQGAKAMWINNNEFIFNSYDEIKKEYISKIYNTNGKLIQVIDFPIYDTYKDKYALSLNFDRLNILRPDYGYRENENIQINWNDNKSDGIYYVDLIKNKHTLLITIQNIIDIHYKKSMNGAKHKINHIMISPNGKKIMFLHRWFVDNRKFDSLIVADIDGNNLKCISDDDMVSHCFWHGNDKIFGYLRDKELGDKYFMIDSVTGEKEIVGEGIIDSFGDGHPNIHDSQIVFDTYPNKSRMKELYIFDRESEDLNKIGEFFESFEFYGETRCDLHPRFSFDGKKVFVDSVHGGKRHLYMINLKEKVDGS